jgi:hypothetical protein
MSATKAAKNNTELIKKINKEIQEKYIGELDIDNKK